MASGRADWEQDRYVTHLHLRILEEAWQERQTLLAGLLGAGGPRLLALTGLKLTAAKGGADLCVEGQLAWVDSEGRVFSAKWSQPTALSFAAPQRLQLRVGSPEKWFTMETTAEELKELALADELVSRSVRIFRVDPKELIEFVPVEQPLTPDSLPLGTITPGPPPGYGLAFRLGERDWFPPFATTGALRGAAGKLPGADAVAGLNELAHHPSVQARRELLATVVGLRRRAAAFAGPPLTPAELAAGLEQVCILAAGCDLPQTLGVKQADDLVFERGLLPVDLFERVKRAVGEDQPGRKWRRVFATDLAPSGEGKDLAIVGVEFSGEDAESVQASARLAVVFPSPPEARATRAGSSVGELLAGSMAGQNLSIVDPADLGLTAVSADLRSANLRAVDLGRVRFDGSRELYLYLFGTGIYRPAEWALYVEQT